MIAGKIKKWGNSFGVLIPKKEMEKMNLKEDQEVIVEVTKKGNPLKELYEWGKTHKLSKPTEQILKEARKDMGID